jgi:hypothetical protein
MHWRLRHGLASLQCRQRRAQPPSQSECRQLRQRYKVRRAKGDHVQRLSTLLLREGQGAGTNQRGGFEKLLRLLQCYHHFHDERFNDEHRHRRSLSIARQSSLQDRECADCGNTYRAASAYDFVLPAYPQGQKPVSESRHKRRLRRPGTARGHQPQSLRVSSATAQGEDPDRGISDGPPSTDHGGINWRKVGAVFLIFLLIGSLLVFFILYALSLL